MADSALSPREIQARVRAGASVAEVAEAAGVSEEHIELFAGPVLAERDYVVGTALDCPVRRRGEPSSARTLRQIVTDHLRGHNVPFDDVIFDAWRDDDRRWHISARYTVAGEDRVAELLFDARARFSIPGNDEGRWLVGEQPLMGSAPRDPDAEPTIDLNDEWAIVRAVQEGEAVEDQAAPTLTAWGDAPPHQPMADDDELSAPIPIHRPRKSSSDPPDYAPAQLEQVDGVYDIVPHDSEMDVLYEMLAGFNEDSVKIYAGLTQPVTDQTGPQRDDLPHHDDRADTGTASDRVEVTTESVDVVMIEATYQSYEVTSQEEAAPAEASEPTRRIRRPTSAAAKANDPESTTETSPAEVSPVKDKISGKPRSKAKPRSTGKAAGSQSSPKRVDAGDADAPQAAEPDAEDPPARRARKKGRAQVPSWDEIMFGGPASTPPDD